MSDTPAVDTVVANPTYMADVRFFFRDVDIDHMRKRGRELGTYEGVKASAYDILDSTEPPNAFMPKDEQGKWSADRHETFNNWITTGFPLGAATPATSVAVEAAVAPTRVRKDVTTLSDDEFALVMKAFTGLMERDADPSDDSSYYGLAGTHGLPKRWCQHLVNPFAPWHRYSLGLFEDALRSVPGCSEVTLPYWDISTDLPDRLQHPPIGTYTLPRDPGLPPGQFPYTTVRNSVAKIAENVRRLRVVENLNDSLTQSRWGRSGVGGFMNFFVLAHDSGHNSIGDTMADQDVAAFDPVFWFFHCNLDRIWVSWQTRVRATTLPGFLTTLDGDTGWVYRPVRGYDATPAQIIPACPAYDRLDLPAETEGVMENLVGSTVAARTFSFRSTTPVSVRVKGIERLNIPGSFIVSLLADGEEVAAQGFFQSTDPNRCDTCAENAVVNIDFRLPQDRIVDRALSVRIDLTVDPDGVGAAFPLDRAGNPTINARLLAEGV